LQVLKNTVVAADGFSQFGHHTVRLIDRATLYKWLAWMLSPSSRSAAGMVMREAMLLSRFGRGCLLAEPDIQRLFKETSKGELSAPYTATFNEAIARNGRRDAAPGQFLHHRRQGPHAGAGRQLRYRARTGALPAAPGAGTAGRRLVQHRDHA